MAKLIAVCLVAALLAVALPICSVSASGVTQMIASTGHWMGQLERKEGKSKNDWAALEKGYSKKLYSKTTLLNADELYEILLMVKEAHEHLEGQRLAISSELVDTLLSRRQNIDCEDDSFIVKTIEDYNEFYPYPRLLNYLTDSVSRYLQECKYEAMFKQAISGFKEEIPKLDERTCKLGQITGELWNWNKYPTLYDYWMMNIRPLAKEKKGDAQRETIWLIRLVKKMSGIDCSDEDLRDSLVTDVTKSLLYHSELYALVDYYFMKYLRDCGFEDRFETILDEYFESRNMEYNDIKHTFEYNIRGGRNRWKINEDNKGKFEDRVNLAIQVMSRLVPRSQIDESHCNRDFTVHLRDDVRKIEKADFDSYLWSIRIILKKHSQVCQDNFIAKGKKFKDNQQDKWSRVKMFAAAMKGLSRHDNKIVGVNTFKIMLREGSWKEGNRGLTVTDLKHDVEQPCEAFLDEMESSIDALDHEEIKDDTSVMEFYVPLEYCAIFLGKGLRNKD